MPPAAPLPRSPRRPVRPRRRWAAAVALLLCAPGCDDPPGELPTAAEIAAAEGSPAEGSPAEGSPAEGSPAEGPPAEGSPAAAPAATEPPLYQLLYDAPLLPEARPAQQRARMLVWLRHMAFSAAQLDRLEQTRAAVVARQAALERREAEIAARTLQDEERAWSAIAAMLSQGVPVDAPELQQHVDALRELRAGGARERELLSARLEGIRAALDAQAELLRSLTPRQEQLLSDAVFFLRHRLDPVAHPGDFRAIVGTVYEPGQYAVLTRGLTDGLHEPLDIGGLWGEPDDPKGHPLHDAKREVILLLALIEPGMAEALEAARALAAAPGAPPPGPPAAPAPPDPPPPARPEPR